MTDERARTENEKKRAITSPSKSPFPNASLFPAKDCENLIKKEEGGEKKYEKEDILITTSFS